MLKSRNIILGTVQFGLDYGINNSQGKPNQQIVNRILDKAFESGIVLLDTAEAYGNAQEMIGEYHNISAHKFKVITKFSSTRTDLPTNFIKRVKANIKTLNVDNLYCYMFHNYTDFKSYYKNAERDIVVLKKEALIEKIGVSIYTNKELEDVLNYPTVNLIQLPFNLLDNAQQRLLILEKAKAKGIEIHTRSAFLQGLFFKELNQLPEKLLPLKPYLEIIKNEIQEHNLSITDLALNYVINQSTIDNVLIGVDSIEQLKDNIESLNVTISDRVMRKIDTINVVEKSLLNPSNWN